MKHYHRIPPLFLSLSAAASFWLLGVFLSADETPLAETVSSALGEDKAIPAEEYEIVHTSDGLPIEARVLGLSGERVKIRLASSQREMTVSLWAQDPAMRKRLVEQVEEARQNVQSMSLRVTLMDNPTREKTKALEQRVILEKSDAKASGKIFTSESVKSPAAPKSSRDSLANIRLLLPGSRCLRIDVPSKLSMDVPLEGYVYWFARRTENSAFGVEFSERFSLIAAAGRESIYYTQAPTFTRMAYQGYAVLILNRANNSVLYRGASSDACLNALEQRHPLPVPKQTTDVKKN
ncbi:MAG: hypothetical protein LBD01_01235 [Puniceicoccales bacterium]|jgi:hypothetical protein|nr:hypothetical protein [Puniceicoccales bacterium]